MLPLLVLLGTIAGAWYLLIVRPQKEQQTRHGQLVERLQVGDHVLTVGGIYGRVVAVEGPSVVLELAPGLTSRIATDGIARIVHGGDGALPPTPAQAPASSQEPPTALDTAMQHHPNPDQQQAPQHAAPQYHAPTQPWSAQAQPPTELPAPRAPHPAAAPIAAASPTVGHEPRPWGDLAPVNLPPQPMLAPSATPLQHGHPQPAHVQYARPSHVHYAQPAHVQHAHPAHVQYAQAPAGQYVEHPAVQYAPVSVQYAPAPHQHPPAPMPAAVGASIPSPPPMPLVRPFAEPTHAPRHVAPAAAAMPAQGMPTALPHQQPHGQPPVQPAVQPQLYPAHLAPVQAPQPAHSGEPVHAAPQEAEAGGRRHSRAPQGMGSSLRLDDPSLRDTMSRARGERAELADEYRKLTAPLVDAGTPNDGGPAPAPAQPELQAPPGTAFVGHDPNGVPLYAAPGAPAAHPVAMYPVPARPEPAAMPRPVVQATGTAVDPALSASAFQRRTPYAPDPALQPQGAPPAQPALA